MRPLRMQSWANSYDEDRTQAVAELLSFFVQVCISHSPDFGFHSASRQWPSEHAASVAAQIGRLPCITSSASFELQGIVARLTTVA